jgi:hypothetical protein
LQREIDLVDGGFLGIRRQLRLGKVHLLARIGNGLVDIDLGLELDKDAAVALRRNAGHSLDTVQPFELFLDGLDDQAFGIFRADAR